VGLDSPLTPPPPLTSFTGLRSRIMASFRFFLSRRQTDSTTWMFGSCLFMFKRPSQLLRGNLFSDESGGEQAEKFSHAALQRLRPDLIADRAAALFRIRR